MKRLQTIIKQYNNRLMEKEMKIIPPVGYEIDTENSTFDCIKFKPVKQELTYEDVCKKILIKGNIRYFITMNGSIKDIETRNVCYNEPNDAPTKAQLEKILAINQLQNIANYYNGNWKPNWENEEENKYSIFFDYREDRYDISLSEMINYGHNVFKKEADAQAVIDNPNFREILDKIYKS